MPAEEHQPDTAGGRAEAVRITWVNDTSNLNDRRMYVNGEQWAKVYGWDEASLNARCDALERAMLTPPDGGAVALPAGFIDWLKGQADDASMDVGAFSQEGGGRAPNYMLTHERMLHEALALLGQVPASPPEMREEIARALPTIAPDTEQLRKDAANFMQHSTDERCRRMCRVAVDDLAVLLAWVAQFPTRHEDDAVLAALKGGA